MPNVITINGLQVVGGLEWIPLEAADSVKREVREAIARRKELVAEEKAEHLLSGTYALCDTRVGTYAVGIFPATKERRPQKRAVSLAALCAMYAQQAGAQDCFFAWKTDGGAANLVAIKNGLPIFDGLLPEEGVRAEFAALTSLYDSGFTVYGDTLLLPPPVAALGIEELAEYRSKVSRFANAGTTNPAQIVVIVAILGALAGYFYWEAQVEAERFYWEAQVEAERERLAQQVPPEVVFADAQKAALAALPGCGSADAPIASLTQMRSRIGGYVATSLTADCKTGQVVAKYLSPKPADLSAKATERRLMLDESLIQGVITESFDISTVAINPDALMAWQDWLVGHGNTKQHLARVGVTVTFSGIGEAFAPPIQVPSGVRLAMRGTLTVSGAAQFMEAAARRMEHVVWKRVTIEGDNKGLFFNMTGDYYALKD